MADGAQLDPFAAAPEGPPNGLQFGWRRRLPVIRQAEAAECGLACLAMIAGYHGYDTDLLALRRRFSMSLKGATLERVIDMAAQLGFMSRPIRIDLEQLANLSTPCLLHWDLNHFVVLRSVSASEVVVHDPSKGVLHLPLRTVSEHFTGVALELIPGEDFKPEVVKRPLPLRALLGKVRGLTSAAAQVFLLAIALEVFGLASPLYLQWVLDQVLVSADHNLLVLLGLGFGLLTVFSAATGAARSWAVSWLGATLCVQWPSNLFRHLIRLPVDWFEKRHVGDIVSRFSSLDAIQRTLTTQFIGTVLDGVMSVATLVVLVIYSSKLTLLVVTLFVAYALLRLIFFKPFRLANEDQLINIATQQSELLESIRGATPIKLANKHGIRVSRYANKVTASVNRDIRVQRLMIGFTLGNQLIFGLGRIALVWIAASLTLKNQFTIGMFVAYVAFADQFANRTAALIDKYFDIRMLGLHAERLSDIALTPPEGQGSIGWTGSIPNASIELRNVSFRYSEGEPWILRNCSLRIEAGESVAIIGPSGCGKSTLAKIILGLLQPSEGEVLYGSTDIRAIGPDCYRNVVGAVLQDDQLFAGSLAENICFFDPDASIECVARAAMLAAVHADIEAMPMGYQTLVGDMGSSLSGGQKQRVILARALYRKPHLLVLDEATSHLDVSREREVNTQIRELDMTRIIIAHRQETIASADRVIVLQPTT